jgi:hypothetical protein
MSSPQLFSHLRAHLLRGIPDPNRLDIAANKQVPTTLLPLGDKTSLTVLAWYYIGERAEGRHEVNVRSFIVSINSNVSIGYSQTGSA